MTADPTLDENGPRPEGCCDKCPAIVGGSYDCTCVTNPRCDLGRTAIRELALELDNACNPHAKLTLELLNALEITISERDQARDELTKVRQLLTEFGAYGVLIQPWHLLSRFEPLLGSLAATQIPPIKVEAPTPVSPITTLRELHSPFEWTYGDGGHGVVTSCKECARLGLSETAANYPCAVVEILDAPPIARIETMLRLLLGSGDLTPVAQRQILSLWENETLFADD